MKKFCVLFSLVAIMLLTGCGKKSDEVVCKMSQESTGVSMNSTITLKFNSNVLDSAKFEMDAKLDDSIKSYSSYFVSTLESQFESYESTYGVKVNIKETSDGAKIDFAMNKSTFEDIYGSSNFSASKKDVIADLEADGYTCK